MVTNLSLPPPLPPIEVFGFKNNFYYFYTAINTLLLMFVLIKKACIIRYTIQTIANKNMRIPRDANRVGLFPSSLQLGHFTT